MEKGYKILELIFKENVKAVECSDLRSTFRLNSTMYDNIFLGEDAGDAYVG